jgi:hypothetical protein
MAQLIRQRLRPELGAALTIVALGLSASCGSASSSGAAPHAPGIPPSGQLIDDAGLEREVPPPPADAVAYDIREPLRNGRTVAVKKRWIWVPPGSRLEAAAGAGWQVGLRIPRGTKLWKEFYLATPQGPQLVERRLLLKLDDRNERNGWLGNGGWRMYTAHYLPPSADGVNGLDVRVTVPMAKLSEGWIFRREQWIPTRGKGAATFVTFTGSAGEKSPYVFPGKTNCEYCHGGASAAYGERGVPVLAFGSHPAKVTRESLERLIARGWIAAPAALLARLRAGEPTFLRQAPGETSERRAEVDLGNRLVAQLQNNCLSCHNTAPLAAARETGFALAPMLAYGLDDLRRALAGPSLIMGSLGRPILTPGRPDQSELALRLRGLEDRRRMPPAEGGVPELDDEIADLVTRWIEAL